MEQTKSQIQKNEELSSRILGAIFLILSLVGLLAILAYALVALDGAGYSYVGETDSDRLQRQIKFAAFFGLYIFPMIGIAIWNIRDSFLIVRDAEYGRLRNFFVKSGVAIFMTMVLFLIIHLVDPF